MSALQTLPTKGKTPISIINGNKLSFDTNTYSNSKTMFSYDQLSISPTETLSLPLNVSNVILVITRWNDIESRMFVRNAVLESTERRLHGKVLFVFGISKNASKNERIAIKNEQEKYRDMIIPGEFYR